MTTYLYPISVESLKLEISKIKHGRYPISRLYGQGNVAQQAADFIYHFLKGNPSAPRFYMYKFFINEPTDFSPKAIKLLEENSILRVFIKSEADILFVRFKVRVSSKFLQDFPALKCIASPTTGLCHVDMNLCRRHNIKIVCLRDCMEQMDSICSTSEYSLLMMLSLTRNFHKVCWSQTKVSVKDRMTFRGKDLSSSKIGILGMGRIGNHVYRCCSMNAIKVWDN